MEKVKHRFCSILKRITTGFLAVLLSLLISIGSAYKNPVKAEAAATAGGIAIGMLVATALTAMGIGVNATVNNESYQQSCEDLGNAVQEKIATAGKTLSMLVTVGADGVVTMSKEFLLDVSSALIAKYPPVEYKISSSVDIEKMAGLKHFDVPSSGMCWRNAFTDSLHPWEMMTKAKVIATWIVPVVTNSDKKDIYSLKHCKIEHLDILDLKMSLEDNGQQSACFDNFSKVESMFPRFDNPYLAAGSKIIEIAGLDSAGVQCFLYLSNIALPTAPGICIYPKTAQPLPYTGEDVFDPADKAFFAEGLSALVNSFNDVIGRIGAMQGVLDGIRTKVVDWTYPGIRTMTQTTILEKDVTQTDDKDKDDKKNTEDDRNPTLPKAPTAPDVTLPRTIQRKFPFCLPWDLAACYRLFDTTPKAPTWNIPVNVDCGAVHVHHTYTYDLNNNHALDQGLPVFKWFVNLAFVAGLIVLTRKIMS